MRAFAVSVLALSLATPALCAQIQDDAAEALRIESLQNAGHDNWRGRHHYLYDDDYRPETSGAAPGAKECTEEAVQMQRSDGKTTIKHVHRCD